MTDALSLLQNTFGYNEFREHQESIISHLVSGGNAIVLMPTGGGKSLCYQIPAMLRPGTGLVISPLIALMEDQVQALQQLGVKAEALNSSRDSESNRSILAQFANNELDLLYISPERLLSSSFMSWLSQSGVRISLIAIDEAHCVSQWGHDFRPEYLRLHEVLQRFPTVPCVALTATADGPTRKEIPERLNLKEHKLFLSSFDRPNITYYVEPKQKARQALLRFIQEKHSSESGIVYCLSRKKVEDTAKFLEEAGITALPYHAGLSPLARRKHQKRFLYEEGIIMTATIAFGMGINKPNVRFVAHLDLPKSMESYYQETGRAGRDGLPSSAWMTYGLGDVAQMKRMIESGETTPERKRIEHLKLRTLLGYAETASCRRKILLHYFDEARDEDCGNCDNCKEPVELWDGTEAAQMALSAVYRTDQRFGQGHLIDLLVGRETAQILRWNHNQLPTFGVGRSAHSDKEWGSIFRQLVTKSYLDIDYEGFGALKLTAQSRELLRGNEQIAFRRDVLQRVAGKKGTRKQSEEKNQAFSQLDNQSQELFGLLKAKRMQIAQEQGVPPYVIFHDRTLLEIAERKPETLNALQDVHGVGKSKLEKYGQIFIDLVKASHGTPASVVL